MLEPLLLWTFKGATLGVCALGVVEPLLDAVGILGSLEDEMDVGGESVPARLGLRDDMVWTTGALARCVHTKLFEKQEYQ